MNGEMKVFVVTALLAVCTEIIPLAGAKSTDPPPHTFSLSDRSDKLRSGQEMLTEFERNSQTPGEGGWCWKGAVERLKDDCADLSDDSQTRLALELTNCHLQKLGRTLYPCLETDLLWNCTKDMDDNAFNALTTFTAHTSNVCFFLASQLWQERTQRTVNALSDTSHHVVQQLNETSQQNEELLRMQGRALENQRGMIKSADTLHEELAQARREAEDMRVQTEKQWSLWSNNFGQLFSTLEEAMAWLQLIGVKIWFVEKLVMYFLLLILSILSTSVSQTSGARAWMLTSFAAGLFVEYVAMRIAVWWSDAAAADSIPLHSFNGYCRMIVVAACLMALLREFLRYQDHHQANAQKLTRIEQRIEQLQTALTPHREQVSSQVTANPSAFKPLQSDLFGAKPPAQSPWPVSMTLSAPRPESARNQHDGPRGEDEWDGAGEDAAGLDDSSLGESSSAEPDAQQTPAHGRMLLNEKSAVKREMAGKRIAAGSRYTPRRKKQVPATTPRSTSLYNLRSRAAAM